MSGFSSNYAQARQEPSLDEVLRDPIIRMLMAFDGVEEADILPLAQHPDSAAEAAY